MTALQTALDVIQEIDATHERLTLMAENAHPDIETWARNTLRFCLERGYVDDAMQARARSALDALGP